MAAGAEMEGLDGLDALLEVSLDRGIDFTRRGPNGKQVGAELLDVVVEGIHERSLNDQAAPDGSPWPDLSPKYEAWKAKKGYPTIIGVRKGEMMSAVELAGRREITPDEAAMHFGVTPEVIQRGEYFTEGGGVKPRPFYQLDDLISAEVQRRARLAVEKLVDDLGA